MLNIEELNKTLYLFLGDEDGDNGDNGYDSDDSDDKAESD